MTRSTSAALPPVDPAPLLDEPPADDQGSRVVARPDGFYWLADDGQQEFGPFPTAQEAEAALAEGIETGLEPDQTLQEAEDEIGYVQPRLDDEGRPEE